MNKDVACQAKHIEKELLTCTSEPLELRLDMTDSTLETVVKYLHYRVINKDLPKAKRQTFELRPE